MTAGDLRRMVLRKILSDSFMEKPQQRQQLQRQQQRQQQQQQQRQQQGQDNLFSNSVSEREEFSRRTHATKMSRLLHGHYNCRTDFFASIKCTRCLQQLSLTLSSTPAHTHMLTLSHFSSSSLSLFLSHPSLVPSVPLSLIHTHTQAGNLSRSLVS